MSEHTNDTHLDRERTNTTTTTTTGSGGTSGLAFIVGILVVIVAGLAWFILGGGEVPDGKNDVNITIEGAGDAVEGAVESATDGQ